ncbi:hypothetical protein [Mixta intestinalis]|uniref:Uncharacterized protein n=1 Tax=Mixta intestinalis TaxID=1615494 RepID=A0A6P1PZ42_9GAMM|nr:hypothetical protein [Mixta intestinalis]QHM71048.1 hypothetical protein C7M51_01330 [Mixta intestinalis]
MWLQIAEVENMTRRSAVELEMAMQSGRLLWRTSASGQIEIELSSVLSAFTGELAGAVATDSTSRRLEQQWEQIWRRRDAH